MATGARGKGRPKLSEAAEIDRKIRVAALSVLLEHGEGATMNAVALVAGCSRKSLYARYPNKTELFVEVIRELLAGVSGLDYRTSGGAEERLRHYIDAALGVISRRQSQAMQRLLTMDPDYIGALRSEIVAASRTLFFVPLRALLAEAKASGEFVMGDVDTTARLLMRLIFAESVALGSDPPRPPSPDLTDTLIEFVTLGLLPRAT